MSDACIIYLLCCLRALLRGCVSQKRERILSRYPAVRPVYCTSFSISCTWSFHSIHSALRQKYCLLVYCGFILALGPSHTSAQNASVVTHFVTSGNCGIPENMYWKETVLSQTIMDAVARFHKVRYNGRILSACVALALKISCLATDVVALSLSRPLARNERCFRAVR
jgi:hypothetical protein